MRTTIHSDPARVDGHRATEPAIEATDLVKTYPGDVRALDGLSFTVEPGTVFGLLGPNGAGKSTTVKILTTLSRPDAGSARVAGIDVLREPRRAVDERGLAGAVGAEQARELALLDLERDALKGLGAGRVALDEVGDLQGVRHRRTGDIGSATRFQCGWPGWDWPGASSSSTSSPS